MGSMAIASVLSKIEGSNGKCITFTVTGSGSYATGGDTLDLSSYFAVADNCVGSADGGNYDVMFDRATAGAPSTAKVLVYQASAADGGDEVANATDLSGQTFILTVFGR